MKPLFQFLAWCGLPYFIGYLKFWWGTRRSALTTIAELHRLDITPKTIVDAGCNRSQWSRWLHREYPQATIHSIDVQDLKPLGYFHRWALGEQEGHAKFKVLGPDTHRDEGGTLEMPVRRLDQLGLVIQSPAVLKVDCESSTFEALKGASGILDQFCAVIVEMQNPTSGYHDCSENHQMSIIKFLSEHGFSKLQAVDASVWPNHIHVWDALFLRL